VSPFGAGARDGMGLGGLVPRWRSRRLRRARSARALATASAKENARANGVPFFKTTRRRGSKWQEFRFFFAPKR